MAKNRKEPVPNKSLFGNVVSRALRLALLIVVGLATVQPQYLRLPDGGTIVVRVAFGPLGWLALVGLVLATVVGGFMPPFQTVWQGLVRIVASGLTAAGSSLSEDNNGKPKKPVANKAKAEVRNNDGTTSPIEIDLEPTA